MTRLTQEQADIIGAYTGFLCGDFSSMHAAIETKLRRPVFTHEMADKDFQLRCRAAFKEDFLSICCKGRMT
jgi:hypothetical protein